MDLLLFKETVRYTHFKDGAHKLSNSIKIALSNIPVLLTPVEECEEANKFQQRVLSMLEKNGVSSQDVTYTQDLYTLVRRLATDTSETIRTLYVRFPQSEQNTSENMMKAMWSLFGRDNVQFELDISLTYLSPEDMMISTKPPLINLRLNRIQYDGENLPFFKIDRFRVHSLKQLWKHENGLICSKLMLKVTLNEKAVEQVYLYDKKNNEIWDYNRKLLEEEILFDMKVQCENGEMLKCHKIILAGKSEVFKNVLENHKPKYLVMKNMSVECVKALLEYVYCNRVEKAVKSFDVALELLTASLKYQIIDLTNVVIEIFMWKRTEDLEWFSVKNAIKLFAWTRSHEQVKKLRDKAVRVLKKFANRSADQLRESEEYQNLFRKEPMVAIELNILFVQL